MHFTTYSAWPEPLRWSLSDAYSPTIPYRCQHTASILSHHILAKLPFDDYVLAFQWEGVNALPRKLNFARHLRDARVKRGLSVIEVAEQVGVSTASIYFWETDRVRPRDANLSALCKVLKLPVRATREMAAA
jgi:DNA-binding XRE family transcriptional regulator